MPALLLTPRKKRKTRPTKAKISYKPDLKKSYWSMIIMSIIIDLMENDLQNRFMTYLWFGIKMKHFPMWSFIHLGAVFPNSVGPSVFSNAPLETKCECLKSHYWLWEILFVYFPSSFVALFLKKICVVLISLGVCFFTKRVRILVKVFETSMSSVFTFQDFNVFSLYILRLQCLQSLHSKTSMSSVFTFQNFNVFKTSMSSVFTFQDFNVFRLYISRLQCLRSLHFETSMSSVFTFQDFNVFSLYISRLQFLQSLHFETSMSFVFTF